MGVMTTIAVVGGLAKAGMGVYSAIQAKDAEKQAREDKEAEEARMEALRANRQAITNPMAGLTNEAEKIGVATEAARFQAEEADMALANTLDTIMATGAGAGGATALAQAALRSKQGISADIQRQELTNKQNVAATQMKINEQKAQGEKWAWEEQEQRDMMELDRTQNLMDKYEAQEFAYQAQKMEAIGNVADAAIGGTMNAISGGMTDQAAKSLTAGVDGFGDGKANLAAYGYLQGQGY
jgi:hypothetical protein